MNVLNWDLSEWKIFSFLIKPKHLDSRPKKISIKYIDINASINISKETSIVVKEGVDFVTNTSENAVYI